MPEDLDATIFISYRRADTSADAGRLYDALRRRFGRENLFMDVDSIRPGQDWVVAVEEAVGRCDALLALIGPEWNDVRDENGSRRLEDEFDRVRLEIEAALKADKTVIPVLFESARMPIASDLPESLRPLVRRNAIRISHATFDNDLRGLLRALKIIARAKATKRVAEKPAPYVEATPSATAVAPEIAPQPGHAAAGPPPPLPPPPVYPPMAPQAGPPMAPQAGPPVAPYYQPQPQQGFAPQPWAAGATGRGGTNRLLLIGAAALVAAVVIGLVAWALLGGMRPAPTPTPGPTFAPVATATPTAHASALVTPTAPGTGAPLDYHLAPTYGEVNLDPGFVDDPYTEVLYAGGDTNVSYLGDACLGFAAQAPDFRVHYGQGISSLLRFYFLSDEDTTLIISDPEGNWLCADDSFDTLNPTLDFAAPHAGAYDIWVGTISGDVVQGTLHVTELFDNHP